MGVGVAVGVGVAAVVCFYLSSADVVRVVEGVERGLSVLTAVAVGCMLLLYVLTVDGLVAEVSVDCRSDWYSCMRSSYQSMPSFGGNFYGTPSVIAFW